MDPIKKLNEKIIRSLLDDEHPVAEHLLDWNPDLKELIKYSLSPAQPLPSPQVPNSGPLLAQKTKKINSHKKFKELVQEYNQPRVNFSVTKESSVIEKIIVPGISQRVIRSL